MIDLEENKRSLQELEKRFNNLENTIGKIEDLEIKLKELEGKTLEDGFWNDKPKQTKVLQEIKYIKTKYTGFKQIKQTISSLLEMNDFLLIEEDEELSKELVRNTTLLEKDLEKLEIKMLLSGKFDKNNAIITLHPGAGGTESQDWAQMLYRMYVRWATNNEYTIKETEYLDGEEAGIKSVTAVIIRRKCLWIFKIRNGST